MVRDNGPIYSSTNFGMAWTVIDAPGTYEFPLTSDSDGNSYLAKAMLHSSPENQASTNLPPSNWYAVGSAPDGSKMVMMGDSSPQTPVLSIKYSGSTAIVSWPSNFTGFILQQSGDLTATNWIEVTYLVNIVGSENQVTISPVAGNNFYRLKSQAP